MNTCPNCNHPLQGDEDKCPYCSFNLKKYREEFFTDQHQTAKKERKDEGARIASRAVYRQEFYPKKQNTVVASMISWLRENATIAFLLAVLLLIITSFSAALGWIVFFALLIWLYIVCDRNRGKIQRYTADRRLTEKVNQVGSNVFNSFDDQEKKIREKHQHFENQHPQLHEKKVRRQEEQEENSKGKLEYVQLTAIVTSFLSLIILFTGSGASVSEAAWGQRATISHILLDLANRLLSSNASEAMVVYLIWLLLIFLPIFTIINLLRRQLKNKIWALSLSLLENVGLIYFILKTFRGQSAGKGMLSQITNQLLADVVSIGTSTYFLLLTSLLTTILILYNFFQKNKQK